MSLTYTERYALVTSNPFQARVEIGIVKYAVYLKNSAATGPRGDWASLVLNSQSNRIDETEKMRWYVLENVCADVALTVNSSGVIDTAATDAAIQSQIETRINAAYATE